MKFSSLPEIYNLHYSFNKKIEILIILELFIDHLSKLDFESL